MSVRAHLMQHLSRKATLPVAKCHPFGYTARMIKTFAHKGLEAFYRKGTTSGIQAMHAHRLAQILAMLNSAGLPSDMNAPGLRLHPLQGKLKGHWAVTVQANWRLTFVMRDGDAHIINYLDYH